MSYHTDSTCCCTRPSRLLPLVTLFTVVGDVRPPLGARDQAWSSKSRFQDRAGQNSGNAPDQRDGECEVTGPFSSVGSAVSSPSLHAYLAGQTSSARASKSQAHFISRATLFSARAGSLGHASPRPARPACHSPVEPTGGNGCLEFPPLVTRRLSQVRGRALADLSDNASRVPGVSSGKGKG